jgi:sugar phosphate isomerase/epimerase
MTTIKPPAAPSTVSRRGFISQLAAAGVLSAFGGRGFAAEPAAQPPRFRIGACDWSIGQMASPAAFAVARQIGLDGLQVSLGTAANDMALRKPEVQARYREAAAATGVGIGSLAIGEMNNIPYKSDPRAETWVRDSIEVCQALDCRVVLLAFFYKGDLKGDCEGTATVIRRLREVAPKAEQAGVILGIESWLSAEEHVAIIDAVGSPSVQVYYDVANSSKMGYDICREIRWLGRQGLICELHAKENGALLGHGVVDFPRVRAALDDIGYSGWVQIEGAVPKGGNMLESYQANQRFLRSVLA